MEEEASTSAAEEGWVRVGDGPLLDGQRLHVCVEVRGWLSSTRVILDGLIERARAVGGPNHVWARRRRRRRTAARATLAPTRNAHQHTRQGRYVTLLRARGALKRGARRAALDRRRRARRHGQQAALLQALVERVASLFCCVLVACGGRVA